MPAIGVAVVCQLSLSSSAGASASAATAKTATTVATGAVAPNSANELDCNGWSKSTRRWRKRPAPCALTHQDHQRQGHPVLR